MIFGFLVKKSEVFWGDGLGGREEPVLLSSKHKPS